MTTLHPPKVGGLAHHIMLWVHLHERLGKTAANLHIHLHKYGHEIPEWLADQLPPTGGAINSHDLTIVMWKALQHE